MPPMLGGGEMVATFGRDHVEYAAAPHKFEAGTQPSLEAIGLVAALDYVEGVGRTTIATHEAALGRHAREDRKSAVRGKSVSVDVDLVGGGSIKKKKKTKR